jgi:hypothetical protein
MLLDIADRVRAKLDERRDGLGKIIPDPLDNSSSISLWIDAMHLEALSDELSSEVMETILSVLQSAWPSPPTRFVAEP